MGCFKLIWPKRGVLRNNQACLWMDYLLNLDNVLINVGICTDHLENLGWMTSHVRYFRHAEAFEIHSTQIFLGKLPRSWLRPPNPPNMIRATNDLGDHHFQLHVNLDDRRTALFSTRWPLREMGVVLRMLNGVTGLRMQPRNCEWLSPWLMLSD